MAVTLSGITYDLDQADWGSQLLYDDGTLDGRIDFNKVVVHWGGSTVPPRTTWGINRLFRGWQRFHLGKGWQDIAYGAGVGNDGLTRRLRGWNHQGATAGHNSTAWACVWGGGSGGPISDKAYEAMAGLVANALDVIGLVPVTVIGHRDVRATTCPGNDWWDWVQDEGWVVAPPPPPPTMEETMLPLRFGDGMKPGTTTTNPWNGKTVTATEATYAKRSDVRAIEGVLARAGATGLTMQGEYDAAFAAAVMQVTPGSGADTNGTEFHGNDYDPVFEAAYGGGGSSGLSYGDQVKLDPPT